MLWLTSWIAGRWLPLLWLAVSVACLATAYGYGRSHANTRWEARWKAQQQADAVAAAVAQAAADDRLERQTEATVKAAQAAVEKQLENDRLAARVDVLAGRLRAAIDETRRRELSAAAADPGEPEPEGAGFLSVPIGTVAAGLLDFATACSRSRDDLAAQVNGLIDAWPR